MKIREIMTEEVATAELDTTLEEIATMMRDEDTGAIPVLDGAKLAGIITDRDIVIRVIAEGKDATETTAEDILSEDLVTVSPDDDLDRAADLMSQRQIRRLPVVQDGRLVGMVSLGDLAVKSDEDEHTERALENISEGVKASGRNAKSARRSPQPAAQGDSGESRAVRGTQNTKAATREPIPERESPPRGQSVRREQSNRAPQGIANRDAREEQARQTRVVPIRDKTKNPSKRAG